MQKNWYDDYRGLAVTTDDARQAVDMRAREELEMQQMQQMQQMQPQQTQVDLSEFFLTQEGKDLYYRTHRR
jgi:hypothetical protein